MSRRKLFLNALHFFISSSPRHLITLSPCHPVTSPPLAYWVVVEIRLRLPAKCWVSQPHLNRILTSRLLGKCPKFIGDFCQANSRFVDRISGSSQFLIHALPALHRSQQTSLHRFPDADAGQISGIYLLPGDAAQIHRRIFPLQRIHQLGVEATPRP